MPLSALFPRECCDRDIFMLVFGTCTSCAMPVALRKWDDYLFIDQIVRVAGDPKSHAVNGNPSACFFQHLKRKNCVRTAPFTSSMCIERSHKETIQTFEFFCRMRDWTDPGSFHFLLSGYHQLRWQHVQPKGAQDRRILASVTGGGCG